MPEEAVIDGPETGVDTDTPPRTTGFNSMREKLSQALSAPLPSQDKPTLDTRPVEQPVVKPEPKPGEKPLEKPAEAKDSDKPEKFVSPSVEGWKKLKAERDEWNKKATEHETAAKTHAERVAEIERQFTEFKAKVTIDPAEIENLKKEREAQQALLERVALEQTPKFRDYYNSKFEAAIAMALDAAGKDKADQVKSLLEAPKSAWRKGHLHEIISGLDNEVDKLNLNAAVNEYDRTRDERTKQLDNHKSGLQELKAQQAKEKKEQEDRAALNRQNMTKETLKKAEAFEAFKNNDDPEHNAIVAKNRKTVEGLIEGTLDDNIVLMLPVLAAEGERLTKVTAAQKAKIAELEEALAKYQKAVPALEGQGAPKGEKDKPQGFKEIFMRENPNPTWTAK